MNTLPRFAAIAGMLLCTGPAWAEKADADKPVNIEADRVSVDDVKKLQIFEGNVQLVKGTLIIRAERIVISQDNDGYQRGVATGSGNSVARFRQKREGVDEYVEGEAERIEHEAKTEKTEFLCAPGSRADRTKCAGSTSPTMHATNSTSSPAAPTAPAPDPAAMNACAP